MLDAVPPRSTDPALTAIARGLAGAAARQNGASDALPRLPKAVVFAGVPFFGFAPAALSPACVFPDRFALLVYGLGVLCFVAARARIAAWIAQWRTT